MLPGFVQAVRLHGLSFRYGGGVVEAAEALDGLLGSLIFLPQEGDNAFQLLDLRGGVAGCLLAAKTRKIEHPTLESQG